MKKTINIGHYLVAQPGAEIKQNSISLKPLSHDLAQKTLTELVANAAMQITDEKEAVSFQKYVTRIENVTGLSIRKY